MIDATLLTTAEVLRPYAGRPVYLHEVSGNNGDELILRGSKFLIDRAGCVAVGRPEDAEVLLINGGFKSDFWPFANATIQEYSRRFPATPLVILPSSYLFETTDFPSLFAGRSSPATIMVREEPSLDLIRGMRFPCEVRLGLDHDTAFALADDPWFAALRGHAIDRDLLVVERGDAERVSEASESGLLDSSTLRSAVARALPGPARSLAARVIGRVRRAGADRPATPFARDAVSLAEECLGRPPKTLLAADVSRRSVCTFEGFCHEIARSGVVVSTRLHVAILAAVLGRRTFIVAGRYHKIPGIYRHSMAGMEHVSMVDAQCRPQT